jgi:hypothetical protein
MVAFKFSLESWNYFLNKMSDSDALVVHLKRRHTNKRLHCDLMLSSRTVINELTLIRIDSDLSLSCARKLFGTTFGVGVRNRAPNKAESPVPLRNADLVNLVNIDAGINLNTAAARVEREKEFVAAQGIDFIYQEKSRLLKIRVRYSKFLAYESIVAATLHLNYVVPQVTNDVVQWSRQIVPGTFFFRGGELVEVVRLEHDNVAVVSENSDAEVLIDLIEAGRLLMNYIGLT